MFVNFEKIAKIMIKQFLYHTVLAPI